MAATIIAGGIIAGGKPAEATLTRGQRYERRKREAESEAVERRARLWNQCLRIEKYLPELYRQRDEAAARLSEITDLIADEQEAARQIREQVK